MPRVLQDRWACPWCEAGVGADRWRCDYCGGLRPRTMLFGIVTILAIAGLVVWFVV